MKQLLLILATLPMLMGIAFVALTVGSGTVVGEGDPTPTATRTPIPLPSHGSYLYLNSEPGDYIGQGQQWLFTSDDAMFSESYGGSVFYCRVTTPGGELWYVWIGAPQGQPLVPGTYEGAVRKWGPGAPMLDVSGESRGCNSVTGRFVVEDAVRGPGSSVVRFHATFEQHCEGHVPPLFGEIRIENEAIPTVTPTPTPTDTATPTSTPTSTPTPPPGVGGAVQLPPAAVAADSGVSAERSGWSAGAYAALGAVVVVFAVSGWYTRRRWLR